MLSFDIIWYPPEKFKESNLPPEHQATMAQFAMYIDCDNILKHTHENKDGLDYFIDIPIYLVAQWFLDLLSKDFCGNLINISNQYILPNCEFKKEGDKIYVSWHDNDHNDIYFIGPGESVLLNYENNHKTILKMIDNVIQRLQNNNIYNTDLQKQYKGAN